MAVNVAALKEQAVDTNGTNIILHNSETSNTVDLYPVLAVGDGAFRFVSRRSVCVCVCVVLLGRYWSVLLTMTRSFAAHLEVTATR